jgi:serine O-acetyltransferase
MSVASRLVRDAHPRLFEAVAADTRFALSCRNESHRLRRRGSLVVETVRLALVSDAFLAQLCYRVKASLQRRRVPVLPMLFHRLAMMTSQVCIGDPVVIEPGLYLAHGQVVIDGFVRIGPRAVVFPWVTVGLTAGEFTGPTIESDVHIGSGAKVLGPITVGRGARIGANAVVLHDVSAGSTVVGAPAHPIGD